MLIHGSPISAELPSDPGIQDRFWYWHGASGKKYIHSVYAPETCPPLPGAIFVAVRREGRMRIALSVGRFTPFWDGTLTSADARHIAARGADEIHVHLLAKSPVMAEDILADLRDAMMSEDHDEALVDEPLDLSMDVPIDLQLDVPLDCEIPKSLGSPFSASFGSSFRSPFRPSPGAWNAAAG